MGLDEKVTQLYPEMRGEENNPFFEHLEELQRYLPNTPDSQACYENLKREGRLLEKRSLVDALTETYNRRAFKENFRNAIKRRVSMQKHFDTVSDLPLILCDIDYFKQINDILGHEQGDEVLRLISSKIKCELENPKDLYRVGGEEFAIVPDVSYEEAVGIAENVRESLTNITYSSFPSDFRKPTMSFGVNSLLHTPEYWEFLEKGTEEVSKQDVIEIKRAIYARADAALYDSKGKGRNRVTGYLEILKNQKYQCVRSEDELIPEQLSLFPLDL